MGSQIIVQTEDKSMKGWGQEEGAYRFVVVVVVVVGGDVVVVMVSVIIISLVAIFVYLFVLWMSGIRMSHSAKCLGNGPDDQGSIPDRSTRVSLVFASRLVLWSIQPSMVWEPGTACPKVNQPSVKHSSDLHLVWKWRMLGAVSAFPDMVSLRVT
jgi:hypothetical protein